MAKEIRCYVCGAIAYGRTESFGDDRCDDCINRSERLAEIDADESAPPEFKEGRKAYLAGTWETRNPYKIPGEAHENVCEMLWRQGWQFQKSRDS